VVIEYYLQSTKQLGDISGSAALSKIVLMIYAEISDLMLQQDYFQDIAGSYFRPQGVIRARVSSSGTFGPLAWGIEST
jgi:hypothetical protein